MPSQSVEHSSLAAWLSLVAYHDYTTSISNISNQSNIKRTLIIEWT